MGSKKPQPPPKNEPPANKPVPPPPPPKHGSTTAFVERDHLSRKVKQLRSLLSECVDRFRDYEMSVDDSPPQHHRRFLEKLENELNKPLITKSGT